MNKYVTRIFLIDDDAMYSNIIKLSLEQNDSYDITVFSSGETFFNNIHLNPHIVIIYYNLPRMSSLDILKKISNLIHKIENTNLITLITGESGTGKEVVAKTIHYNSPRKRNPFIAVNVAAIPADLIESELFGHEKGAFTGAVSKRIGKFEESHEGTIFLDEIGEMAMDLQTKLLRVLQDSRITRLGTNKEIELNMR